MEKLAKENTHELKEAFHEVLSVLDSLNNFNELEGNLVHLLTFFKYSLCLDFILLQRRKRDFITKLRVHPHRTISFDICLAEALTHRFYN